MSKDLLLPDIGDFEKVEIVEVLVKTGDKIKKNESLVTLESDKSSVEVPSTDDGIIESVNVKICDKISKVHLLATLESLSLTEEKPKKNLRRKITS
jgi:pyruvate dehydrogenase E1 component